MTDTCPTCGDEYERLGNHWQYNADHRHKLTDRQHEIVRGLVLGDGFIDHMSQNAALRVHSTNRAFLGWVSDQFPVLTNGVHTSKTAEELVEQNTRSNYVATPTEDAEYSDLYGLTTNTHPEIADYDNDPTCISSLSAQSLRVYYVCDGTFANTGSTRRCQFSVSDDTSCRHVASLVSDCGFDVTVSSGNFYVKQTQTDEFLDWLGDPLPNFEYKWSDGYE